MTITFSILNGFSKFSHCWKRSKSATKPI